VPKKKAEKIAKTPKVRKSDFAIFLLKSDFNTPDKFLRSTRYVDCTVTYNGAFVGMLYTKTKPVTDPAWLKNLKGATLEPPPKLVSASSSGVLIVECHDRLFALTYGYGRSLLNEDAWEQDFGLKVVLNSIDPEKIRQIERSSFDSLLQNMSAQSSHEAAVDEFGLDVEQDVIRSIRGSSKLAALGAQIRGRDSLHLNLVSSLDSLPALLETAASQFSKTEYRKAFPFIDKMSEVRAPDRIAALDLLLLERLNEDHPEKVWMAIPSVIPWQDGCYLRYSTDGKDETRQDVFWSQFRETLPPEVEITIDLLKKHRVSLHIADGPEVESWRVYRCIYCELESEGSRFILNNAKWYRVDQDYAQEIQAFYDNIPSSTLTLPKYEHASEAAYNEFAASHHSLCLMDRKIISAPNRGRIQIEFCDIFDKAGRIVHVKRYSGSTELSHLFAQGLVSGEMFLDDGKFRESVNQKLSEDHQLSSANEQPDASKYEIVFAIISSSSKPGRKDIPFFSKVNLRSVAQRLSGRGYKVSLADVRHSTAGAA
jgi:uncharacterized protein (TIGR04141 family)